MTRIFTEVIFVYVEIVVLVELPEFAVKNVEMLIWEEVSYSVYIFLLINLLKNLHQIRQFKIPKSYPSIVIPVEHIENPVNHSVH